MAKYSLPVRRIAVTHAAISITSRLYNQQALPVLHYKSQLIEPPPKFAAVAPRLVHALVHTATSSLTQNSICDLAETGGLSFTSAIRTVRAALLCTAAHIIIARMGKIGTYIERGCRKNLAIAT